VLNSDIAGGTIRRNSIFKNYTLLIQKGGIVLCFFDKIIWIVKKVKNVRR